MHGTFGASKGIHDYITVLKFDLITFGTKMRVSRLPAKQLLFHMHQRFVKSLKEDAQSRFEF